MFSDELIGLDIAHRRELRQSTAVAQGIINEQAADVTLLTRALRETRNKLTHTQIALDDETRKRMALQLELDRLNRLLDTPIG
ncbi:hypothetical protein [Devosia sp. MC521]|uniref:hypothetical protein n=1 Tax=Devosia sp. MC521 TaxID=2759954 RepID=UPI0015FCB819|nr:hypothetical protein [Devosia sp. MC521]MBJ6986052.1 hypothetical protein [Devosia sp. MC521]QMW61422.1 hypothetical protein H4N61_10550 [Devosia sp. MC521]